MPRKQTKGSQATVDYVLGSWYRIRDYKDLSCNSTRYKANYIEWPPLEVEEKSYTGLETEGNQINGKKVDELPTPCKQTNLQSYIIMK